MGGGCVRLSYVCFKEVRGGRGLFTFSSAWLRLTKGQLSNTQSIMCGGSRLLHRGGQQSCSTTPLRRLLSEAGVWGGL